MPRRNDRKIFKAPPMTLGPTLMLVAVLDGAQGIVAGWITIFGRVPLFYYIAHIYLSAACVRHLVRMDYHRQCGFCSHL
jgi:hypothetical protein